MSEQCNCDELEERVEELEAELETFKEWFFDLETVVIGDTGITHADQVAEDRGSVFDRLQALEHGEIDATEFVGHSDHALPIQQYTAQRKNGQITEESHKNRYRATFVWSAFNDRAVRDRGAMKLESPQVKRVLDEHGLPTNRNTVRRVMEYVARLSNPNGEAEAPDDPGNLIQLVTGEGTNVLIADREQWDEFFSDQTEELREEAEAELDELLGAEVATDGG